MVIDILLVDVGSIFVIVVVVVLVVVIVELIFVKFVVVVVSIFGVVIMNDILFFRLGQFGVVWCGKELCGYFGDLLCGVNFWDFNFNDFLLMLLLKG